MKTCSIVSDASEKEKCAEIALAFEERGWEVFSPVAGVADKTKSNTATSYLSSKFDVVIVLVSTKFLQSDSEVLHKSRLAMERQQANIRPVTINEEWFGLKLGQVFKDASLVQYSPREIAILIEEYGRLETTNGSFVACEDVRNFIKTICGLDDVSELSAGLSESLKSQSFFQLFRRTFRESQNVEHWLVLHETAQPRLVKSLVDETWRGNGLPNLNIIRIPKVNDLSDQQIAATQRLFDARCFSFTRKVKEYAVLTEAGLNIHDRTYSLDSNSETYVDFDCTNSQTGSKISALTAFHDQWERTRNSEDKRVLVFLGTGGRGKTHLLRKLNSDFLSDVKQSTKTIFLNPSILRNMAGALDGAAGDVQSLKIASLYDAYKIFRIFQGLQYMPENLFEIELKSNRTVVFVDGIEEIRAMVRGFNLKAFWNDCKRFQTESTCCQIVLASRFEFWTAEESNAVNVNRLEPFEIHHLNQLLDKAFGEATALHTKAIRLIELISPLSNGVSPFVADEIVAMVLREQAESDNDFDDIVDFESELLEQNYPSDRLIGVLLDRDKNKIRLNWGVDIWCGILIDLAGQMQLSKVSRQLLFEIIETRVGRTLLEDEKSIISVHCMLRTFEDGSIGFSEMHFEEFFVGMFLYWTVLLTKRAPEQHGSPARGLQLYEARKAIAHLTPGSQITSNIARWSKQKSIDLFFNLEELKAIISKQDDVWLTETTRMKITSCLFNLALELHLLVATRVSPDEAFEYFFGVSGGIEGGVFWNFNSSILANVRFDFRGIELRSCSFRDYDGLWDCNFDEATRWVAPSIFDCAPPNRAGRKRTYGSFENEETSEEVRVFLGKVNQRASLTIEAVRDELQSTLSILFGASGGTLFKSEKEFSEKYRSHYLNISQKSVIKLLKKHGVIEEGKWPSFGNVFGYRPANNPSTKKAIMALLEQRLLRGEVRNAARELVAS